MKKFKFLVSLILLVVAGVSFVACASKSKDKIKYRVIEEDRVELLNHQITDSGIVTPESVASLYQPKDEFAEGNYSYQVTIRDLESNLLEITIQEEGLMDDSVFGVIAVLKVEKKNSSLKVVQIKEAYKCWPNRGHQDWSPEFCN